MIHLTETKAGPTQQIIGGQMTTPEAVNENEMIANEMIRTEANEQDVSPLLDLMIRRQRAGQEMGAGGDIMGGKRLAFTPRIGR